MRVRTDPNYWLLDDEQKEQCEEVLHARILSPGHTDQLRESERQAEARRKGRVYHPPVGEGLLETGDALDLFLEDAALWETAARRAKNPPGRPIQLLDASGSPRPEQDVVRDMTWGERKSYKKQKQRNDQRRDEIIRNAVQAAREKDRGGIWQYNVSYGTREHMFERYIALTGNDIVLSWNKDTGQIINYDAVQMSEILAWEKLNILARMQLHNGLIKSGAEGKLPEVRVSQADQIDNPYLVEITDVYNDSYLDFLRSVAEVMRDTPQSAGLDRTHAYTTMIEGRKRLNALCNAVLVDDSIRQTMPAWFVRQLVDMGRMQPRSARGA